MSIQTLPSIAPQIDRADGNFARLRAEHHPDNPNAFGLFVLDQRAHGQDYTYVVQVQVGEFGEVTLRLHDKGNDFVSVLVVDDQGQQVYPAP